MPDIPVDEELLKLSMKELNALVGMEGVKKEIEQLIKIVRYHKEEGKDVLSKFSLHAAFAGNPGTGKNTVARIVAKIYKALGILERGHLVECDRQDLVAGFVGQTAIKTSEKIDQAKGGILFIDEAYSLTNEGHNDFGKEAIETILKRMEDHRGEFIVIAAGYTDNMRTFLESNPGLKSRFDKTFHFEDYNANELDQIAINMLNAEGLHLDKEASKELRSLLDVMHRQRNKSSFGNGREVRKLIETIIHNFELRIASIPKERRTSSIKKTIMMQDITYSDIITDIFKSERTHIGFEFPSKKAS